MHAEYGGACAVHRGACGRCVCTCAMLFWSATLCVLLLHSVTLLQRRQERLAQLGPDAEEEDIEGLEDTKMKNQFNFSDRASQTFNNPMRVCLLVFPLRLSFCSFVDTGNPVL